MLLFCINFLRKTSAGLSQYTQSTTKFQGYPVAKAMILATGQSRQPSPIAPPVWVDLQIDYQNLGDMSSTFDTRQFYTKYSSALII